MDRETLIDRKQQVIADIRRCQMELNQLRLRSDRLSQRRVQELERRLESLMAEEYRLRQAIDRSQ
jgi:FtsZ-binding cell division protein ZapB